jgi:hypothetical protein
MFEDKKAMGASVTLSNDQKTKEMSGKVRF